MNKPIVTEDDDFTNSFKERATKFMFQDLQFDTPHLSMVNPIVTSIQHRMRDNSGRIVELPSGLVEKFFSVYDAVEGYNTYTDAIDKGCSEVVMYMEASFWLSLVGDSRSFGDLLPDGAIDLMKELSDKGREAMYAVMGLGVKVQRVGSKRILSIECEKDLMFLERLREFHPVMEVAMPACVKEAHKFIKSQGKCKGKK